MEETITISRLRYESIIFFAITGWMIALFLFGIFIGASL